MRLLIAAIMSYILTVFHKWSYYSWASLNFELLQILSVLTFNM